MAQVYGYTDVLVINNDVPARTPLELAALARANRASSPSGIPASAPRCTLAGELFKAMAHVDIQQVPFRGSTLVITDVIGGRVTVSFIPPTGTLVDHSGKEGAGTRGHLAQARAVPSRRADHGRSPVSRVSTSHVVGMVAPEERRPQSSTD